MKMPIPQLQLYQASAQRRSHPRTGAMRYRLLRPTRYRAQRCRPPIEEYSQTWGVAWPPGRRNKAWIVARMSGARFPSREASSLQDQCKNIFLTQGSYSDDRKIREYGQPISDTVASLNISS